MRYVSRRGGFYTPEIIEGKDIQCFIKLGYVSMQTENGLAAFFLSQYFTITGLKVNP